MKGLRWMVGLHQRGLNGILAGEQAAVACQWDRARRDREGLCENSGRLAAASSSMDRSMPAESREAGSISSGMPS